PVIEVVAAAALWLRVGRNFILSVAGERELLLTGVLDVPGGIVFGQAGRWPVGEGRARLQGELVVRDVGGLQRGGAFDVVKGAAERLLRQRVHQVDIEIVEARVACL